MQPNAKTTADFAKYIAQSVSDQIKQADTKAFGTIGIIGISISALLGRLYTLKEYGDVSGAWWFLFFISAVLIVLSIKLAVNVVFPRASRGAEKSFTYFKGIIQHSEDEFAEAGKSLPDEAVSEALYRNAYQLSQIATKKYEALRKAMILTAVAVAWTVFTLLFS